MTNIEQLLPAIDFSAIRAQGAGGQNVNKVSSAIHLRFRIHDSLLPEEVKLRLLNASDNRVTRNGEIILKSQNNRTQEMNKQAALERLKLIIDAAFVRPKVRKQTKPSRNAKRKRLDNKKKAGAKKALRTPPSY